MLGRRSQLARWSRASLIVIGVIAAVLCATELALVANGPADPAWLAALLPLLGLEYLVTGLVAWDRRPGNRTGLLIVVGGIVLMLAALANTNAEVLVAIGLMTSTAILAVIIHVLLAFPSGRVERRGSRWIVGAGYFVAVVLQAPLYLFSGDLPPFDVLSIADRPDVVSAGVWVQRIAGLAVVLATAAVLARRVIVSSAPHRRVLAPLYVGGLIAVVVIPIIPIIGGPVLGLDPVQVSVGQIAVLAAIPLAFAAGLLLGGFARTGELAELATRLGAEEHWSALPQALAETLGDPTARLLFWLPEPGTYADLDGRQVDLASVGPDSAVVTIELDGRTVGAIVYHEELNPDPAVVQAAGGVIALALHRERLIAELRVERQSLRESRARLVEAGEQERRRIARDLHDGIQATLLIHAMHAHELVVDPRSPAATAAQAGELQAGLERTVRELRRLVHGLMPVLLVERGLYAAVEDLIDTIPIPATLAVEGGDRSLPGPVESAAYFVIVEALANAVKHAEASAVSVRIRRVEAHLQIEVADDGIGGADVGGSGLRGVADRVTVLGGRLGVTSPAGGGTRLVAELPCAS